MHNYVIPTVHFTSESESWKQNVLECWPASVNYITSKHHSVWNTILSEHACTHACVHSRIIYWDPIVCCSGRWRYSLNLVAFTFKELTACVNRVNQKADAVTNLEVWEVCWRGTPWKWKDLRNRIGQGDTSYQKQMWHLWKREEAWWSRGGLIMQIWQFLPTQRSPTRSPELALVPLLCSVIGRGCPKRLWPQLKAEADLKALAAGGCQLTALLAVK